MKEDYFERLSETNDLDQKRRNVLLTELGENLYENDEYSDEEELNFEISDDLNELFGLTKIKKKPIDKEIVSPDIDNEKDYDTDLEGIRLIKHYINIP